MSVLQHGFHHTYHLHVLVQYDTTAIACQCRCRQHELLSVLRDTRYDAIQYHLDYHTFVRFMFRIKIESDDANRIPDFHRIRRREYPRG